MRSSPLHALAAASGTIRTRPVVTVAILAADPLRRRTLEGLLRDDPAVAVAELTQPPNQGHVRVLLADAPTQPELSDWRSRYEGAAIVALLEHGDPAEAMAALEAGADAVLARTPTAEEIAAALKAVAQGLAVLPRPLVALLREGTVLADVLPARAEADTVPLTPRELDVLAAMADGASNKAIARRLGMSFHTAKFHVAAILAKLDADTRTEAVAKAAQRGLVML